MIETFSAELASVSWGLAVIAAAFVLMVFAASTMSLQTCMAMFGKEIPSYGGAARLKLRIFGWIGVALFLGYGFLGSLFFLAAPIAFLLSVGMIAKEAKCDRFMGVLITLCHIGLSGVAAMVCGLVFYVAMPWIGIERSEVTRFATRAPADDRRTRGAFEQPRPVSHSPAAPSVPHQNPFVDPQRR